MINSEEELKNFHPSIEIGQSEDAIYQKDFTDFTDVILNLMKQEGRDGQKNNSR